MKKYRICKLRDGVFIVKYLTSFLFFWKMWMIVGRADEDTFDFYAKTFPSVEEAERWIKTQNLTPAVVKELLW